MSEFLSEARERPESVDALNHPADTEQMCKFPKHRQTIHVEADAGMAEQLCDVEKVTRAAPQIEDPAGARKIEFELTDAANVHADPAI